MNFGKGFFCRVGLSLATATAIVVAIVYAIFNLNIVFEKIGYFFGLISVLFDGLEVIVHIPGLEFVLMALISFIISLTFVMSYVNDRMSYSVKRSIISGQDTFNVITFTLELVSTTLATLTVIVAFSIDTVWLFTFVSPAITFLVIAQYDLGFYKKVCKWITNQD